LGVLVAHAAAPAAAGAADAVGLVPGPALHEPVARRRVGRLVGAERGRLHVVDEFEALGADAALAAAVNEKPSVINDYESGKAIPNGAIISKLNRALGVRLPKAR